MATLNQTFELCEESYTTSIDAYERCLFNVLNTQLSDPLAKLQQLPQQILNQAGEVVKATARTVEAQAVSEMVKINTAATNFISHTDSQLNSHLADISDTIKDVNASVYIQAETTANRIDSTFSEVDDYIRAQSIETSQVADSVAQSVIDDISALAGDVASDNAFVAEQVISDVNLLVNDVQSGIRHDIDETILGLEQVTTRYVDANSDTIAELTDIIADPIVSISQLTSSIDAGVVPSMTDMLGVMQHAWFMKDTKSGKDDAVSTSTKMLNPEIILAKFMTGDIGWIDIIFGDDVNSTFFGAVLAACQQGASNVLMGMQAATIANSVKIERMLQELWKGDPARVFSFPDVVSLNARGHIDESEAVEEAAKSGYDEKHFQTALNGVKTPLSVEQAVQALNRGFINEDEFENNLIRQGYNEKDRKILRASSNIRPALQDLVTMAVRDVFSVEAINEFKLFDELPSEFVAEAGQSGLDEYWAEKYWGAHWRLPSLTQGFEMFHRSEITEAQLKLLIKMQDVSPFWRDKLINIAYKPYTRVDVRRMYKMGVLTREEVYRSHLDLGYSPDKAEKMTQFVTDLVDDAELEDDVDPRLLTQSQIKTLYKQGTIHKDDAIQSLIDAGYSSSAALLLVGSWETDEQIKERETIIKLIISKAVREQLDTPQVDELFSGIDLTVAERENILRQIALKSSEYPSQPSKSELLKMQQAGIITTDEWIKSMHGHGYSRVWIDRYAQLWGVYKNEN